MKRILILSDSLALPRSRPEQCTYDQTYSTYLKRRFIIHQVSIGGATSSVLLKQLHYHLSFEPDIIVLQVGIVDCVPRFMTRKELDFSYGLGISGKGIRALLNRGWIRKARNVSYVNIKNFRKNLNEIKLTVKCPIIAIEIIPGTEEYENILPGVTRRVDIYNKAIREIFTFAISTEDLLIHGVMSDHHHLNAVGHQILSARLDAIINSIDEKV